MFKVIGDVHWTTLWKKALIDFPLEWNNKVLFLGDYVDSHFLDSEKILDNLIEIINLKKQSPNSVILLLWNHDIQYIWNWNKNSWFDFKIYKT
jgi:hypothetical protein